MLISDFQISVIGRDYARFISSLSWFRMYCVGSVSTNKDDYVSGFNSLKHYYDDLFYDEEEEPFWVKHSASAVFEKIQRILENNRFTEDHIAEMGNLLYDFETNDLSDFEWKYFQYQRSKILEEYYPKKLYDAVHELMNHNQYESAVLAAFKFLDSHLQTLLSIDANRYYGEDLINYAFSPNSGVLQLQGHPNEQIGIRNFHSGANAIFRNPSAHRFVEYNSTTAEAIIAMVAMMANLASRIKENMDSNMR